MLLRVIIATRRKQRQKQLSQVVADSDAIVEIIPPKTHLWEELAGRNADFVIIDREFVPEPAGQNIRFFRQLPDAPDIVILSNKENARDRAALLSAGCEAVVNTTLPSAILEETLLALLNRKRLRFVNDLNRRPLSAQARLSDFVSLSPAMQAFMKMVARVINSDASLLICGETGVGKERLARAIHTDSHRSSGPFVAVNCGALPETLLESEMFGHEQGAFTGATRTRRGCFELAHQGTIFLDEISEMPIHLQVKLLRVLQEYEIQPLGSEKTIKVQVRLMAATNRSLEEEVRNHTFRKDLYYRLSVVTLSIPPLRDRKEDIPVLVENYIDYLRPRIGPGPYRISPEVMQALCDYAWPGNIRELINVIERAMLICDHNEILPADLPESLSNRSMDSIVTPANSSNHETATGNLSSDWLNLPWRTIRRKYLASLEKQYFTDLLAKTEGRIGRTADLAGIQTRSLFTIMKKHNLRKESFKI
ncbi:MAG: sigma-54-dependent Fis family transcriptional regulator [Sedimentisphaerales bacterium]|nr:sigma-54-dependent Fis family transcriptional regulator [Sedimentisphaerales bacterium]